MKQLRVIPLLWLLLGGYLAYASSKLRLTTGGQPGAGFFPFGAALLICAIALVRLLRSNGEVKSFATSRAEWGQITCVIVGMAAYALLLEPLGFALCTFLLMAVYLRLIATQSWPLSLSFAASVSIAAHIFFDLLLKAQLPRGLLAAFL